MLLSRVLIISKNIGILVYLAEKITFSVYSRSGVLITSRQGCQVPLSRSYELILNAILAQTLRY